MHIPHSGSLLPGLCDYAIDRHFCNGVSKVTPSESLVARVFEDSGGFLVIVISSDQQSTMVHHRDPPASGQSLRPRHTSVTRYVQIRILINMTADGPVSYDNPRGRILCRTK